MLPSWVNASDACCVRGKKEDKTGQKERRRKKVPTRRLDSRLMADFPDMVFLVMVVEPMKRIVSVGCSMLMFLANKILKRLFT
jgi:hypothetical protein